MFSQQKLSMPSAAQALPGRSEIMPITHDHIVLGHPLTEPFPAGMEKIVFGFTSVGNLLIFVI